MSFPLLRVKGLGFSILGLGFLSLDLALQSLRDESKSVGSAKEDPAYRLLKNN